MVEPDGSSGLEGVLVFPLSASSEEALRETAGRLADWVDTQEDLAISDLAYTLGRRRGHRSVRTAVLAGTANELSEALREIAAREVPFPAAVGPDGRSRSQNHRHASLQTDCGCTDVSSTTTASSACAASAARNGAMSATL